MGASQLDIYRGDDKIYDVTIKNSTGTVVDITNYTVRFTVRKNAGDSVAVISKATGGSGITLTNPTAGVARITLLNTDTNLPVGKYIYDIELVDTSGRIITVLQDNIKILQDVTRI